MENLFRLVLTRPAVAQDEETPSIPLAQNTDFQVALAKAYESRNRREAVKAVAREFIGSRRFVGDPKDLAVHDELRALDPDLDALEAKAAVTAAQLGKAVEDAFGKKPGPLVTSKALDAPAASLRDSLIAIKLLPEEHRRPIEGLTNQLRTIEVIVRAAASNDFPADGATLRRNRHRSVLLPTEAELGSILSTAEEASEAEKRRREAAEQKRKTAEERLDLFRRLSAAVDELTAIRSDHVERSPQVADAGFAMPAVWRPTQVAIQELTNRQQVTQLNLARLQASVGRPETVERVSRAALPEAPIADVAVDRPLAKLLVAGNGPFTPMAHAETAYRLRPTAERTLSPSTLEILGQRDLSVTRDPLDSIVDTLQVEITSLSAVLDQMLGRPVQKTIKRVGNAVVMITTPMASVWNSMVVNSDLTIPDYVFAYDARVPQTHGAVAPAGVADLLVIKQQLVRYEGADAAHIENVLKGERKEREHSRRRETEELTFLETEVTTTEERELESTTRFEMSRETSETIREDASLKAGLTVTGKYGPVVEFSASAEGSVSRSKEVATKSAATFAQDVTERSAYKVTERILERSSLRVTNEVIEKNVHELNNVGGGGHISGVYQWVNKVYQAQMFNYGIRMMYDFMVPEPAAFLISVLQGSHAAAVELDKPAPFTLRPDQISEWNYYTWVQQYGATDVSPPPEMYKTKSLDFKAGGGDSDADYNHSGQIAIDDGYKAVFGVVGIAGNVWESNASIDTVLGRQTHRFSGGLGISAWSTPLSDETDSVPFAMDTWKYSQIAAAVEVKVQRTERAVINWRLDTHAKLTTAYKARLAEYEEKLAALEVQAGVAIRGMNPALNQELIKDELKKHCITILTEQHFDLFDAIQTGSYNVPQIDLYENEAEGPYVRFFEQAFEWEQVTWVTYPYFWGRKGEWDERIAYEDVDPLFNQFLKAGYCRVTVPVRPGFEGAVDHFTTFGEIWNGGPLPTISNPLYLPIADELAERLDRPGTEIPEGDPWEVRIPTTLVHLRADDKLPAWKQDANGNWIEA